MKYLAFLFTVLLSGASDTYALRAPNSVRYKML